MKYLSNLAKPRGRESQTKNENEKFRNLAKNCYDMRGKSSEAEKVSSNECLKATLPKING